jgi:putative ABC transport system permease protein
MNKLLESAGIALEAIWGSKLRSLMTVLGNIVAVMSIVAVVSLIQGLNASVKDAILRQAGADSFGVQQFPLVFSDE